MHMLVHLYKNHSCALKERFENKLQTNELHHTDQLPTMWDKVLLVFSKFTKHKSNAVLLNGASPLLLHAIHRQHLIPLSINCYCLYSELSVLWQWQVVSRGVS